MECGQKAKILSKYQDMGIKKGYRRSFSAKLKLKAYLYFLFDGTQCCSFGCRRSFSAILQLSFPTENGNGTEFNRWNVIE
uniref:Uncharacterized protein n=1 Tax=Romanomermis culicivorax TaxID=13658 RepID=A0A915K8Q9_ROMCU